MAYEKEKKTAVALEYTPGEQAPKVIASGRGYLADKIIDVAKEENVPIHKDEKLARSLSVLDIGEYIPQELYSIVAEVLVFVDDMDMNKIHKYGPLIEKHEIFPEGTNVNFVKIIDEKNILVRTWERGCGYTLGCGTGITASVIISNYLKKVKDSVKVTSEGGSIIIDFIDNEAYMTGKAIKICEGNLEV